MCSGADGIKNQKNQTTSLSYTDIFQMLSDTANARFAFFLNLLLKGKNDCDIYIKISQLMKQKSILIGACKF